MPSNTQRAVKPDPAKTIVDAAMRLALEKPWTKISMGEIAQAASVSPAEVYRLFSGRQAILDRAMTDVDQAMLDMTVDFAEPLKDRLFELLMGRFDSLRLYKGAISAMEKRLRRGKPDAVIMGLWAAQRLAGSMRQALEAAGVPVNGAQGDFQAKLLAAAFISASRSWLEDESADHAETMASLDRGLQRIEPFLRGASFASAPPRHEASMPPAI